MKKVDFALRYAEAGFAVILLAPGTKVPRGGHGVKDASRDPSVIRKWWADCPEGNVGLAMGEISGVIAIDVDPRHGGDVSIRTLAAKGRPFPDAPRQRTANGGYHLLYRWQPGIRNSSNKIGPGVDTKSDHGYIVATPSIVGPSDAGAGGAYRWEVDPFTTPPPRMPIWMSTLLNPPRRPASSASPDDLRNTNMSALERFVASAPEGERNRRLYWAACRVAERIGGALSKTDAARRLLAAAAKAGHAGSEAVRTVESAFKGRKLA